MQCTQCDAKWNAKVLKSDSCPECSFAPKLDWEFVRRYGPDYDTVAAEIEGKAGTSDCSWDVLAAAAGLIIEARRVRDREYPRKDVAGESRNGASLRVCECKGLFEWMIDFGNGLAGKSCFWHPKAISAQQEMDRFWEAIKQSD